MNTVKRWLAGFLSFAMIFTSAAFTNVGALAVYAADTVATVTTDDTTEPIPYDTLDAAITATNDPANASKHAKIKLQADATISSNTPITIPLEIDLNGQALTGADKLLESTKASTMPDKNGNLREKVICRKDVFDGTTLAKVVFASHTTTAVYNWKENNSAWAVDSVTYTCPNCGTEEVPAAYRGVTNPTETGYAFYEYEYVEQANRNYYRWNANNHVFDQGGNTSNRHYRLRTTPSSTKTVETVTEAYVVETEPYIVTVNGVVQHKEDGTPLVKGEVKNTKSYAVVDGKITVTKATDDELKALAAKSENVYGPGENATKNQAPVNDAPTCTTFGTIVYKAVMADPNGDVKSTRFIKDTAAVAKTEHEKGVLVAYEISKKSAKNATDGYASELEAKSAAKANGEENILSEIIGVVNNNGVTKYYYWIWGRTTLTGTPSGSQIKAIDTTDAIKEDGHLSYRAIYTCDGEVGKSSPTELPGDLVDVNPNADATTAAEARSGKSTCEEWVYPNIKVTYSFKKNAADKSKTTYTFTGTIANVPKTSAYKSHVSNGEVYTWDKNSDELFEKIETRADFTAARNAGKTIYRKPTNGSAYDKYDGNNFRPNDYIYGTCHLSETDRDNLKDSTCQEVGQATVVCTICGEYALVEVPKKSDTYGIFTGDRSQLKVKDIVGSDTGQTFTLKDTAGVTVATVTATCTKPGGVFNYCTTGHWVLQETIPATGHNLSKIATLTTNGWSQNTTVDYNPDDFYTCEVFQQCSNPGCPGQVMTYHSNAGKDDDTNVYEGIIINDESRGADCQTDAKTIYTVKGIEDTLGRSITTYHVKNNTKGPHKYEITAWNWSNDFRAATATGKCTVEGCTGHEKDSLATTVTQQTATTGITTFTGAYENEKDTKDVYTLADATVSFDESAITDGNLVEGVIGKYAPQTPDVTVTINGTVIDPEAYKATWTYNATSKVATASVDWTDDVKASKNVDKVLDDNTNTKKSINVAADKTFTQLTTNVYTDDVVVNSSSVTYDPEKEYNIETTATPAAAKATVKYAVLDKEVTVKQSESAADPFALQKKIEALNFDKNEVAGIKNVGKYFVYAQISAEDYTTHTIAAKEFEITAKSVTVYVDNATVVEGDKPNLHIRATDSNGDVKIDPADFTITTVGGESIENLKPGTYKLRVTATNYNIITDGSSDYVATLTVLPKDDSSAEDQAKAESVVAQINSLKEDSSEAEVAAARKAYDSLSENAKARIDAATLKKLTDAEEKIATDKVIAALNNASTDDEKVAAYEAYSKLNDAQKAAVEAAVGKEKVAEAKAAKDAADKKAAEEKAAKELAEAKAAANNAIAGAKGYESDSNVKAALEALNKAVAANDTAAIKAATTELNNAVAAAKKAATAGPVKGKTYTVGGQKYYVSSATAVKLAKAKNKKTVTVPATVTIKGKKLNVTGIKKGAFGKKTKTVKVKTKKLTKKGVKNSLKGSKVKTVKVPKKSFKKYKKYFTKKNCGKKVTIKK